jgi:hypothetical protein
VSLSVLLTWRLLVRYCRYETYRLYDFELYSSRELVKAVRRTCNQGALSLFRKLGYVVNT